MGLLIKSVAPSWNAFSIDLESSRPVTIIIEILLSSYFFRISVQTSKPLISGILTSSKTTSGARESIVLNASRPLSTSSMIYSSAGSASFINNRITGSLSTIKMRDLDNELFFCGIISSLRSLSSVYYLIVHKYESFGSKVIKEEL